MEAADQDHGSGHSGTFQPSSRIGEAEDVEVDVEAGALCSAAAGAAAAAPAPDRPAEGPGGGAGQPEGAGQAGAPVPDAGGAMMSKINAFNEQREEERKRMYTAVIRVFFTTLICGPSAYMLAIGLSWVLHMRYVKLGIDMFGHANISASIVILSTCPHDMLSIDDMSKKTPWIFVACSIAMAFIPAVRAVSQFPHLDGLLLLLCATNAASVLAWRRLPQRWPATTTLMTSFLVVTMVSWGSSYLFPERNEIVLLHPVAYSLAGAYFLCATFVITRWQLRRRLTSDRKVARGMAFYEAMYTCIAFEGVSSATRGIAMILWHDPVEGVLLVCTGFCLVTPPFLLMLIGRSRLFKILGRKFDRDGARLRRDGAFIAELLDNIPVNVGQLWWIHRETEDERYGTFDPRRRWVQGRVAAVVSEREILVQLPESSLPPTREASEHNDDAAGAPQAAPPIAAAAAAAPRASRLTRPPRVSASRPSAIDRFSALGRAGSKALSLASAVRVQFNSSNGGKRKSNLLLQAQENLRCVDFESLTPDLMVRVESANDPELQSKWYMLSRPVRPRETIDYFMSNSWYDDPEKKWQKLCEVAEGHRRRCGRYPTLWLDKLCIDQTSITDGLKVLPVNVMACNKLLALCGDTYLSRLWCIWELFTLFAFVTEASALGRVEFVFLGEHEEGIQMLKNMKNFHVKDSHCYDPNEESRLRQVIEAVGTSRFNQRIQSLAALTCTRLEQQQGKKCAPLAKTISERSLDHTTVGRTQWWKVGQPARS